MLRLNSGLIPRGHILAGLLTKSMSTQGWKMPFSFTDTSSDTQHIIVFVLKSIEAKIGHECIIIKKVKSDRVFFCLCFFF